MRRIGADSLDMLRRLFRSGWFTMLLCVAYALFMAPLAPGFATPENFANVIVAMLPLLVVATGQTLVMITAGIDLSVTSTIALSGVAGAALITGEGGPLAGTVWAVPAAVAVMLLVGMTVGLFNGACVAWLKMPPFIVTLTTMMFISGLAIWFTQSRSFYELPASFLWFGQNPWASATLAVLVAIGGQTLLNRTLFGAGLRAVGHNPRTAEVSGVNVPRVLVLAYVVCGAFAAVASIMISGQLETASPVQWENNLLDVIGATVIGGTSLYGGRGSVWWTASGVLLLALVDNSLNLLSLSYFSIMMAKGGVILFAATLDTLRSRAAA